MSPRARLKISRNAQSQNGWGIVAHSAEEIQANHERLLERNTAHRRLGYDPEASVRFVIGKALPLSGRVLDIGTGKGRFVVALARHVANLIAFVLADARHLPWPAGRFDAVTSWNVFHHLEDPGRVFAEMLRVLKPTGKLILADFSMSGFRIMDAIPREEGRRHPHPPSRFTHWQARLHLAGFGTHRYTAWHQDLLVAGPRLGAMVVCGPVPDPDHAHRAKP